MTPPTDVIVLLRMTREFPVEDIVARCMASLLDYTKNFRLIFVDDNSDSTGKAFIDALTPRFPESLLVRTHKQHWFTKAANLGLRMIRTDHCVILNCDTVLGLDWLEELYAVKAEIEAMGQRVGLVGSVLSGEEPRRYAVCQYPGYVTGHCWLVSMQALYEVSARRGTPGIYLDETRPDAIHIRSDVYMCYDMMSMGWNCISSFKSAVGHDAGKTWGHRLHMLPTRLEDVAYKY